MRSAESPGGLSLATILKHDLPASLVVFLVALPLCMGIALASGVAPAAGLVTGIIAGLVVGLLAGSPLQVSGPAAGLSVVVLELVNRYRADYLARTDLADATDAARQVAATEYALGVLGMVVFIAGVVQLLAGLLRLGQWFRAVSPAVIQGMLAGIGLLILASQFHVMIDDAPRGDGLDNLLSLPESIWKGFSPHSLHDAVHRCAAGIGIVTILALVFWKSLAPRPLRMIPAPLVAVVLAMSLSAGLGLPIRHVDMPDSLLDAIRVPTPAGVGAVWDWSLVTAGLMMAVIASAETLLCATAVDKIHQGPRTQYDRELAAQGVGNLLCGLLGGVPMTGVIVRSAANVEAGARTRLAAVLHGAWLLGFICLAPHALEAIPTSSLAAILVYTGYKLMNPQAVRALGAYGRGEVVVYAATVVGIVGVDLLTGVLLGVALSAAKLLYTFCRLSVRVEEDRPHGRFVLQLRGSATFLRLPKLAAALEEIPAGAELHVACEGLHYIDHACLDLLMNWQKQHEAMGGSLVIDWDVLTARFHHRLSPAVKPSAHTAAGDATRNGTPATDKQGVR